MCSTSFSADLSQTSKTKNNYYNYSCLFCDGMDVIGVAFDDKGISKIKTNHSCMIDFLFLNRYLK
jgi:hypothetical protein